MKKHFYYLFLSLLLFSNKSFSQCSGGTLAGTLTPTASYQTQAISNGQYYNVNVSCGSSYNFTFCSNGGSASWDTQITLLNNSGVFVGGTGYNDDNCGLQSSVSWTSTFTGTIRVLISLYACNNSGGSNGTLAYNMNSVVISPAFTLTAASCNQATASISGSLGGVFSFNPLPGDGATINTTTGTVSNGVPGSNYTVQYTVCGSSSTQNVTLFSSNCWDLNGNAQFITVGGQQCIQLTAETNNQTGCAWDEYVIDFNSNFTLSLDYYFGNNINGADGTTFTFQPYPSACGTAGGQLGAGGIPNSLVIEFDTYDNDNPAHLIDIAADHIAVEIDGDLQNSSHLCGPTPALPTSASIDDGIIHSVDIEWVAATNNIKIYFDGNLRLSCTYDFVNLVFGGDNTVYWGATAATGGLNNQQYFCPETVIILPSELVSFEIFCQNEKEIITWSTESEINVDHFEIEYTFDGMVFYPIGQINAFGNSTEKRNYRFEPNINSRKQRYYRLKTVDMDGKINTTELISGKECFQDEIEFLKSYNFIDNSLSIEVNKDNLDLILYAADGKVLINENLKNEKTFQFLDHSLAQGIYLISLYEQTTGIRKAYKLYLNKSNF